jgi:hypothetical protein
MRGFCAKSTGFELFPPLLRISARTSPRSLPQLPPELEDVVGEADEISLSFDCGKTSQKETRKGIFSLKKSRRRFIGNERRYSFCHWQMSYMKLLVIDLPKSRSFVRKRPGRTLQVDK